MKLNNLEILTQHGSEDNFILSRWCKRDEINKNAIQKFFPGEDILSQEEIVKGELNYTKQIPKGANAFVIKWEKRYFDKKTQTFTPNLIDSSPIFTGNAERYPGFYCQIDLDKVYATIKSSKLKN